MGSIARYTQYQCTTFIRTTVLFNQAGIAAGIVAGHIPNGARISGVEVFVDVAQNAGTTNTVSVGTIPETNGVLSTVPASQSNLVSAGAAGTVGLTKTTPTGVNVNATTDLALIVSLAQTGTAATAGSITVIVTYYPNV
jgi:hypothetical protein